jgi:hypothetical protein
MKSSARTAQEKGQENGRDVRRVISVDLHFLKNLLLKNDFSCPNTGHKFVMFNTAQEYQEADTNKTVNPLMLPSADRIDSSLDYIEDNIEITTIFYNNGKGNKTKEQALEVLNIKTKTMSIKKETFSDELLVYLAELGRFDLCEKYFTQPITQSNKIKTKVKASGGSYSYHKNKKAKFEKLVVHVNDVVGKKCISNEYPTIKDLIASKETTKLIESNTTIYAIPREGSRGFTYHIDK